MAQFARDAVTIQVDGQVDAFILRLAKRMCSAIDKELRVRSDWPKKSDRRRQKKLIAGRRMRKAERRKEEAKERVHRIRVKAARATQTKKDPVMVYRARPVGVHKPPRQAE